MDYQLPTTISDIITAALDEKMVSENTRTRALDLLVLVLILKTMKYFEEIKKFRARFMLLLEKDNLRVHVVPVISLLAKDVNVRKAILSQIISLSTSPGNHSFKGYITLLSRLILDQRLKTEPLDYVTILLACTLVRQPRLHLRFQVASALWCYYNKLVDESTIPDDLVSWFTIALFGRHATKMEVDSWCELSSRWLSNSPVESHQT
ncbi:hypothetical protein BDQ17DRAFT_1384449 [Cyathus striatus]|nr:hypothetical protein BDQ17DRAFT_1384449 [Cyathus striatus]